MHPRKLMDHTAAVGQFLRMTIRTISPGEESTVAALIHTATNAWYKAKLGHEIFNGKPEDCKIFTDTYELLDPGCCVVAESDGKIVGSCFYHPRETHVGVGIMAVSPDFTGAGVGRALLDEIIKRADDLPLRLVSSAMNLDSFSLYTRAGFGPVAVYQDMRFPADAELPPPPAGPGSVRMANVSHLFGMADLEEEISGIRRAKDLAHFVRNPGGYWTTFVHVDPSGKIDGWLSSVDHPGCRMIGPGVMRDENAALALLHVQLSQSRGGLPVFLIGTHESYLIAELYRWGARNVEIHFAQVRGAFAQPQGIIMPTFLPETG
jgi:GNAT superfamily N-acetyltransferase